MLSAQDEGLSTSSGKEIFRLSGQKMDVTVTDAMDTASIVRTIAGAPTLGLTLDDPFRKILKSGVWGHGVRTGVGPFTYRVVSVNKQAGQLDVTCEDAAVSALRAQTKNLRIKKGTMTHVQFAKSLVNEVPWLKFITDPAAKVVVSKEDLTRGHVTAGTTSTSWDVLTQNAQARGWRCFIRGVDEVWYVPDKFLFDMAVNYTLREHTNGVDTIDFELDEGQRLQTATLTCRSRRWQIPPGIPVLVADLGPADGKWLVQDITRNPLQKDTAVTLVKPQAQLPEPSSSSGSGSSSATGGPTPSRTKAADVDDFVAEALSQVGKSYVYGASPSPSSNNPTSFDCSSLVEWSAGRVGVSLPRTSEEQYAECVRAGTVISVDHAEKTRGALLFEAGSDGTTTSPGHVAISLGNGETIEARGTAYGVNEQSATSGRAWTFGALVPGLSY